MGDGESFYRRFDDLRYLSRYPEVQQLLAAGKVESPEQHWRTTDGNFQPFWWAPVPATRPIRVAVLTPSLWRGGAERWVETLVSLSDKTKVQFKSILLINNDPGICPELGSVLSNQVKIHAVAPPPGVQLPGAEFVTKFHENLDAATSAAFDGVDAILIWGLFDLGQYVGRFSGRVVFVSHGSAQHCVRAMDEARRSVSHIVAVSQAAAVGRPAEIIYNGVDLARIKPTKSRQQIREGWGITDHNTRLVGYVGRFNHEKNPLAAVQAVSGLPLNYRAVIVGDSREEDRLEAEKIAPGRVTYLGHVSGIGNVLLGLDAIVVASFTEAHSLTLCEAWAAGLPAVCTPVGAVPELEEKYGRLSFSVPLEPTSAELASAVRDAVAGRNDPRVRRAELLAKEIFSAEFCVRQWESFFERICRTTDVDLSLLAPVPLETRVSELTPNVTDFDRVFYELGYLNAHPEVADEIGAGQTYTTALEHWECCGQADGFPPVWLNMQDFDGVAYLQAYPRLKDAFDSGKMQSPAHHFVRFGNKDRKQFFRKKPV